jgi:hypothetical protein
MRSQISVEVILLVIIVCGAYYMTHRNNVIVIPGETRYLPGERRYEQSGKADDRYTIAPRPQREWQPGGGLEQIATRGSPERYQQMGILDGGDGKLLPLYGRRVAPRSDYFNYYTRTDTYNPVAVPVKFKKRDCQDSVGCHEVSNGDELDISLTGQKGKVTLYGFDGPRYEP